MEAVSQAGLSAKVSDYSDWTGRRVLVTGATGLVGSWLVKDLIRRGAHVVAFVRDPDPQSELYRSGDVQQVSVVRGSLEEFWSLERAVNEHEVHTVFHLGAQPLVEVGHRFPLPTFEANVRGTYNILEACRLHRALVQRIIVASSDKAYGEQPNLPYVEDMALSGRHPYEVSKSCADLIAQAYHKTYRLPVAIARCGNVYGGADLNWSRVVPGTIRACLQGEPPLIRSDGTYVRDYIYVKDVARAYMCLAENLHRNEVQGEAFNFSSEKPISVLDLVRAIQTELQCEHLTPVIENRARGEIHDQYLSAGKARKCLKWEPEFTLPRALQETIAWYGEYLGTRRSI